MCVIIRCLIADMARHVPTKWRRFGISCHAIDFCDGDGTSILIIFFGFVPGVGAFGVAREPAFVYAFFLLDNFMDGPEG